MDGMEQLLSCNNKQVSCGGGGRNVMTIRLTMVSRQFALGWSNCNDYWTFNGV